MANAYGAGHDVLESKVDVARNNDHSRWVKVLRNIVKREYIIKIVRYIRFAHRELQSLRNHNFSPT